jgi:chromodomain-helicase-DNA-binding protein 4
LFTSSSDSDQDLDKLIEKTETEDEQPKEAGEDAGHAFSFAKVWTAENDGLEEVDDQAHKPEPVDSWAHTLERIAKERAQMKTAERTGRGVRRKAAMAPGNQVVSIVPLAIN